jgi:hypothetical protein
MKHRYSQVYGCLVQKLMAMAVLWSSIIFGGAVGHAAIMMDNSASVATNNANPIRIDNLAISSNSNRLLIVMIGNEYVGDNIKSVTFGGVDMVLQTKTASVSIRQTFIYSLAIPTVGTTDDIVVTWGAGADADHYDSLVAAMSLYGDRALAIVEMFSGTVGDPPVFTDSDGTGALTVNDYVLAITDSGASLAATPTSMGQNGNSDTYTLGSDFTGILQPDQVI